MSKNQQKPAIEETTVATTRSTTYIDESVSGTGEDVSVTKTEVVSETPVEQPASLPVGTPTNADGNVVLTPQQFADLMKMVGKPKATRTPGAPRTARVPGSTVDVVSVEPLENGLKIKHIKKHGGNTLQRIAFDPQSQHVILNEVQKDVNGMRPATAGVTHIVYQLTGVNSTICYPGDYKKTGLITNYADNVAGTVESSDIWPVLKAFGFSYSIVTRKADFNVATSDIEYLKSLPKEQVQSAYDEVTNKISDLYKLFNHNDMTCEKDTVSYQRTSLLSDINDLMKQI